MGCQRVLQELDAFLEGRLSSDQAAEVDAHLRTCDSCLEESARREELLNLLSAVTLDALAPLPTAFTDQVMLRIHAEAERGPTLLWPWLQGKWTLRQYWSAAEALATTVAAAAGVSMLVSWESQTGSLYGLTTMVRAFLQGALSVLQ